MKPFLLSFFILISSQLTFSQSWNPFPKDQNSYFKQQNQTSTIVENFLMDSILTIGNLQILYFNVKSDLKDECNASLKRTAYAMYWAKNENKIDSLQVTGDSLLFINNFDSKPDTFIFRPLCKLNESWTVNGITIQCAEVGVMNLFGEPDSIKTFRFSGTGFNSIEFILSKSHGFIKFLPFNAFHSLFILYNPLPSYFELIGFNKNGLSKGYKQPDFNDYFHLSAGDILYWREVADPWDIQQRGYTKYHIDTIKYTFISTDSVSYKIKRIQFDENGNFAFATNFSERYLRKDEGRILSNQTSWVGTKYETSEVFFLKSLELKIEKEDTITFANYVFGGYYLNSSTCETHMIYDVGSSVGFSTREGKIFQGSYSWGEYSNTLIGSIINGIKHGITDIPTGINPLLSQRLKVYPNPVTNYLTIDDADQSDVGFEIYDFTGNLLISEKLRRKVDVSALAPGVYILKVLNTTKVSRQFKIVKQH